MVCAVLALAFVLFLIFVSPVLLERTLSVAPPPAPQVVASGELDGRTWSVTALDRNAGETSADGHPVEEEPCSVVDLGESTSSRLCVLRRGESLRGVEAVVDASGRAVVHGIVSPQVTDVELRTAGGEVLRATPSYVDFGFPLGFFALEVDAATAITAVRALDGDGVERATASCASGATPLAGCSVTEGDY